MADKINTALEVEQITRPGIYPVQSKAGGLYLQVTASKDRVNKSWLLRIRTKSIGPEGKVVSKPRSMGLGKVSGLALKDARDKAYDLQHAARKEGRDPIEERLTDARTRAARATAEAAAEVRRQEEERLAALRSMSFRQAREQYVEAHKPKWRSDKHAKQWTATLTAYADPVIGDVAISEVDVGMINKLLTPIWSTKAETARRVRGRLESILDWATVLGYRVGENPARWRGHLQKLLPERGRAQKPKHHAALPFEEIGAFMVALHAREGAAARALELTILTAARTSEVLSAAWTEFDLNKAIWSIPAERMKAGDEHRVPLSTSAVAVLKKICAARDEIAGEKSPFVFPGGTRSKPLSNMSMLAVLNRMKRDDLTVHGFRSTFRDWAAERTNFSREVAEAALAHTIQNKVEAAYRRGDLFEKRRRLMQAWADYCAKTTHNGGEVISIARCG